MTGLYDEIRVAIHAIWIRRWLALAVAWAIAVLGWLLVAQIPNSYESQARVFVQLQTVLPSQIGADPSDQAKDIDTVRQTLTSAINLEKVVRGTDLANGAVTDRDVADRVAGLQDVIKITAEQDNLFEITASASKPKLARQIVQKLIDIFVNDNLAGDRDASTQTLAFLDAQLADRQKQLQDADAKRTDFENRYLGSLPGTGSLTDRLSAARAQINEVDGDLAAAQSSLNSVSGQMAATPASVPGLAGASSMGPARARLAAIQGQLADARAKGDTENHPDVVALKGQLAAATAAAHGEPLVGGGGGGSPNPVYMSLQSTQVQQQAQVAALTMRKRQLQGDMDSLNAKLAGDPAVAAEQSQIEGDYQVMKDSYDKLLASREDAKIRSQAQTQTDSVKFSVIDPPTSPRKPTAPNRPMLLTGVLLAGILGGIGAAFGLGQIRTTFPTAGRLEHATGMTVIGSVGEMVTSAQALLRRRKLAYFGGGAGALVAAYVALLGVEMLQRGLAA